MSAQELHVGRLSFEGLFGEPRAEHGDGSLHFERDGEDGFLTITIDGEKWPYRVRLTRGDLHFLKLWLEEVG